MTLDINQDTWHWDTWHCPTTWNLTLNNKKFFKKKKSMNWCIILTLN